MLAKKAGFTLFEVLIVIIVLGIMIAGSSELLRFGFVSYLHGANNIDADMQGHAVVERMTRDLHTIRSPLDIGTATAGVLAFNDTNGNSVTYQLTGTQLMRNSQILADNASNLVFTYYDANGNTPGSNYNIRYINITFDIDNNNGSILNFRAGTTLWNLI